MNHSNWNRIFEPFYRAHTDSDGHGLGLTIVKQLCTRYGWKLKIRSKQGEGTRITVAFPKSVVLSGKTESHRSGSEQENW